MNNNCYVVTRTDSTGQVFFTQIVNTRTEAVDIFNRAMKFIPEAMPIKSWPYDEGREVIEYLSDAQPITAAVEGGILIMTISPAQLP